MTDAYLIFGSLFLIGIALAIVFVFTDLFWDCWDDVTKDELIELEKYRSDDELNR
tara:strand:+ start:436 stop:600 length:165 start_codon:yes stop_codon:yes gene_type:complete